jgi:DNA-binding MarR family transcriptional regulator
MVDYKELLILIYLNDYKDQYTYTELKRLCNFSNNQLKSTLQSMEEKGLITYQENILEITHISKNILKEKNLSEMSINDLFEEKVSLKFNESPLKIGEIYIPKDFKDL